MEAELYSVYCDTNGDYHVLLGDHLRIASFWDTGEDDSGHETLAKQLADQLNRRTSQPEPEGWISVEERLPDMDTPVWMYDPTFGQPLIGVRVDLGYVDDPEAPAWGWANAHLAVWHNGKRWDCDPEYDDDYRPTHWMPLPNPPIYIIEKENRYENENRD